jgi:hypothetical protein
MWTGHRTVAQVIDSLTNLLFHYEALDHGSNLTAPHPLLLEFLRAYGIEM